MFLYPLIIYYIIELKAWERSPLRRNGQLPVDQLRRARVPEGMDQNPRQRGRWGAWRELPSAGIYVLPGCRPRFELSRHSHSRCVSAPPRCPTTSIPLFPRFLQVLQALQRLGLRGGFWGLSFFTEDPHGCILRNCSRFLILKDFFFLVLKVVGESDVDAAESVVKFVIECRVFGFVILCGCCLWEIVL